MLSAVVLARNEAHRIERTLRSLSFCDEIVVVDSGSTDGTAAVCEHAGARVVSHPFEGYAAQHRFADSQARGPWILTVDADEVVTPQLASEVRAAMSRAEGGRPVAWRVPHLDFMFGRWVRHGGWYPQYHVRLYRKDAGTWKSEVHERFEASGPVGTLAHPLLHYSHLEVSDFVEKLNRYTTMAARRRAEAGERVAAWRLLLEPPAYFVYKYVWQRGFLDGVHGLILASLMAFYRLTELSKVRTFGSGSDPGSPP